MAWLFYQDVPLIATGASYVQVGYFNGVGPVNTAWQACKLSWRAAVHILPGLSVYTPLVYGALMNSASFCHTFKCVSSPRILKVLHNLQSVFWSPGLVSGWAS